MYTAPAVSTFQDRDTVPVLQDVCSLPAEAGDCLAAFPRYAFNADSGECEFFTYGGCGGNGNNFETVDECEAACGRPVRRHPRTALRSCASASAPCGHMHAYHALMMSSEWSHFVHAGSDPSSGRPVPVTTRSSANAPLLCDPEPEQRSNRQKRL